MEVVKFLRVQWDRSGAVAATVLAVIVLLLGYKGTADTEFIAEQIPYLISGGLLGIVLLTVGAVLWLSADLRDEWRELSEQGEAIRREQIERRLELKEFVAQEISRQAAVTAAVTRPARSRRVASSNGDHGSLADDDAYRA